MGCPGPHAVTSAGTNSYGYDVDGNMTTRNNQALTYDYDNRVSSITTGAVATSYVYDFQGTRVEKSTNVPPSTTIYIGNLLKITDGVVTENIFAGNRLIASRMGSDIYYYHPDHLGGLNVVTDGSGNVVQSVFYYPYGETLANTGSVDLPYKFTGKENDPESGLYYYGARYYDPMIGRFISPDSVVQSPGDPQTLNRYSYCRDNPLNYVDPTGHVFWLIALLFWAGVGAAAGATIAAITGGNIGLGALTGAITAGAFFSAGTLIGRLGLMAAIQHGSTVAIMEASAIHFVAGAAAGAINASITGGNIGLNALESGASAGVAYGAAAELGLEAGAQTGWLSNLQPEQKLIADIGFQTTVGSLSGGVTAELGGGNFMQGMGQGAWTAAFGFIFNDLAHLAIQQFQPLEFVPAGNAPNGFGRGTDYGYFVPGADALTFDYAPLGYLGLGVGGIFGLLVAPEALAIATTFGLSYAPQINQYGLNAVDFLNGYLPGTPPPSPAGYLGAFISNTIQR